MGGRCGLRAGRPAHMSRHGAGGLEALQQLGVELPGLDVPEGRQDGAG